MMRSSGFRRYAARLFLLVLTLLAVALTVLVAAGLHDKIGKADVAIVLGSKVETNGTPSPRLKARLERAIELYQAKLFPYVIVSGGTGREGYNEAEVMRGYLMAHGIPFENII